MFVNPCPWCEQPCHQDVRGDATSADLVCASLPELRENHHHQDQVRDEILPHHPGLRKNTVSYRNMVIRAALPNRGFYCPQKNPKQNRFPKITATCKRREHALSSGVVEGFDTKTKLTIRKAYGFRTYHGAEVALYQSLGKFSELDFTHRFC